MFLGEDACLITGNWHKGEGLLDKHAGKECICVQVRGFWAQLEAATNERQQAMFRVLNTHLARLAQRVETVVGDLLEVGVATHELGPTSIVPLVLCDK